MSIVHDEQEAGGPGEGVFSFAFVGMGRCWDLAVAIITRQAFSDSFPWAKLVGRVAADASVPESLPDMLAQTPVYASCRELFAAHPHIDMALDLTPDASGMEELRRVAPRGSSLIAEETAYQFCRAAMAGALVVGGGAQLRAMRDTFTALIDQSEKDILILNQAGKVTELNQRLILRLGGEKKRYLGMPCAELQKLDLCFTSVAEIFADVMHSGKQRIQQSSHVTDDGRMRHCEIYAFPTSSQDGHAHRVVLLITDVSAKIQLEQRLQQSEKMAAVGELSTYIAHEIRNPLFAIGGFANALLRSPTLDDAARDKTRVILEESKRLDEILRSIINFARPTAQGEGALDVNEVAVQTVELMSIGGYERSISINLELTDNLPMVRGNAETLKQCLINLVKNSQEAMPTGGDILIRTKLAGPNVLVQVEDNGPGIPPELHEQVFSPFFSTKDKGAGLGLAMTRKLIEELGGHVHLFSQVDKGAVITLTLLPLLAVNSADEAAQDDGGPL